MERPGGAVTPLATPQRTSACRGHRDGRSVTAPERAVIVAVVFLPGAVPPVTEPPTASEARRAWHAYYTEKRIVHQWLQVHLLQDLPVQRVLEIGPYFGLVTAMLANAGYEVTTLDIENRSPGIGAREHIQGDVRNLGAVALPPVDAMLCCETLEHIAWPEVDGVLAGMAGTGIPWLILSVPYEGTQIGFSFYANRFTARRRSFIRKLRFLKRFRPAAMDEWEPHKWEIGYAGHSLPAFKSKLADNGWRPERQDFTDGCRSVFLVCRNTRTA